MPRASSQLVSGRYGGRHGEFEVELRIDVDGPRPLNRVSADYFRYDGDERVYTGSMRVDAPRITHTPSLISITGAISSTLPTDTRVVKVAITRGRPGQQPCATLSYLTRSGRIQGRYECTFQSASFRSVVIEEDSESGVMCMEAYDTGSLPSPPPKRTLTHRSAFADAGVEMVRTREPGVIVTAPDNAWSDAELHAAMVQRFTAFADEPRWAIWLLHARRHEADGAGRGNLAGLMFDQRGRQRQGCALFYDAFGGAGAERLRIQLLAAVHELAHGFNLRHSFEKSPASPPLPSRPRSATWMAYPHLFPGGSAAFWSRFAFQFDDTECTHLRHAFRDDVIMGANSFTAGAAFEDDARERDAQAAQDAGVTLMLRTPAALPFGMPVTADVELSGTTRAGRLAPSVLGPRARNLEFAIRGPGGQTVGFEPLLRHCRLDDAILLRAGGPAVRDSAFIHYGRNGFGFDRPGRYEIRARCSLPDGSRVLSNVVRIEIRPPATRADKAVADLVFGEQQGTLMSLVGSDAPELQQGADALRIVAERYPAHPVASVARIVAASNAAREFKSLGQDGTVVVRPSRPQEAVAILRGAPGLQSLRQAARHGDDPASLPKLVERLLGHEPAGRGLAVAAEPFIRSRVAEIAATVPPVLASALATSSPVRALGTVAAASAKRGGFS